MVRGLLMAVSIVMADRGELGDDDGGESDDDGGDVDVDVDDDVDVGDIVPLNVRRWWLDVVDFWGEVGIERIMSPLFRNSPIC